MQDVGRQPDRHQLFVDVLLQLLVAQEGLQVIHRLARLAADELVDLLLKDPGVLHHALGHRAERADAAFAGAVQQAELRGGANGVGGGRRGVQRQQQVAVIAGRRLADHQHRQLAGAQDPLHGGADEDIAQHALAVPPHHQQVAAILLGDLVDPLVGIALLHRDLRRAPGQLGQFHQTRLEEHLHLDGLLLDHRGRLVLVDHVDHAPWAGEALGQGGGAQQGLFRADGQIRCDHQRFHRALPPESFNYCNSTRYGRREA
ncbi:hypothetical protein D3C80_1072240 [compost metagenome]